jgi:hypothetical protein
MPARALSDEGIIVVRAGSERIGDLQPLWESLHEHHAAVAPHLTDLGPVRSPRDSWEVRRELYEEWLAEPDAFVLIAQDDQRAVGYAVIHMRGRRPLTSQFSSWSPSQVAESSRAPTRMCVCSRANTERPVAAEPAARMLVSARCPHQPAEQRPVRVDVAWAPSVWGGGDGRVGLRAYSSGPSR